MIGLLIWFAAAWIGGTAAILGSLMAIATLVLWCVPSQSGVWQNRLKLLGFSVGLAIGGFAFLFMFSGSPTNVRF